MKSELDLSINFLNNLGVDMDNWTACYPHGSYDKQSIKMDAHGGHSVLFIYPPFEEKLYMEKVKSDYSKEEIIDISESFVEYIDQFGLDEFTSAYNDYQSEPQKLFKGFLELIIMKIEKMLSKNLDIKKCLNSHL